MLKELNIRNYFLINDLSLNLSKGFTLITGETGAGKSVLIGAIMLLLGEKPDVKTLYNSEKKCIIEGVFDIDGLNLHSFFEEQALDYLSETIIRREIMPGTARSRAFINDTPVTNVQLKILGAQLIDIHSQHETLNINNPVVQLQMIDQYGKLEQQAKEVKALFLLIKKQKMALSEQTELLQSTLREQEFRQHALQELTEANIKQGEIEDLEQEYRLLSNVDTLKTWLEKIAYLTVEQDPSMVELLKILVAEGEKNAVDNEMIEDILERLRSTFVELYDIADNARHLNEKLGNDPEQLQKVEARLDYVNQLIFKYRVQDTTQLLDLIEEYQTQVDGVFSLEKNIEELQKQIFENEYIWNQKTLDLQKKRIGFLPEIEGKITRLLRSLGMPEALFTIHHEVFNVPSENGIDKINFLFTANKGQQAGEIHTTASGGELSRIMLVIKNLLSDTLMFPTMIFDEIDTGISGSVAVKAGEMLKNMSKNKQIIAITHLPTIAAFADQHLHVNKETGSNSIHVSVRYLDKEERIKEIALMLSGDCAMQEAIETAKKLIDFSAKY